MDNKFKVGDRVKVTAIGLIKTGHIGQVTSVDNAWVHVEFKNSPNLYLFFNDELKVLSENNSSILQRAEELLEQAREQVQRLEKIVDEEKNKQPGMPSEPGPNSIVSYGYRLHAGGEMYVQSAVCAPSGTWFLAGNSEPFTWENIVKTARGYHWHSDFRVTLEGRLYHVLTLKI